LSAKKKKQTPSSDPKSPSVPSADSAATAGPLWRAVAAEPIALGLALFILWRPWRDGLTFPAFNAYYAAIVLVVAALWVARCLLRGESLRFPAPLALLGAFLAVAYLTGFATYHYDLTHRGLHTWTVYALLFLLATNGLRSWTAIRIVLVAVGAAWLLSALWAIFHYFVMLRGMRQVLADNPAVMYHYFGTLELTSELKDRLESNRAFGSFLFPNALGAFLVLGIPFLAVAVRPVYRAFQTVAQTASTETRTRKPLDGWKAFALGIAVYVPLIYLFSVLNEQMAAAREGGEPPIPGTVLPFVLLSLPAIAVAVAAAVSAFRHGYRLLAYRVAAYALPVALFASVFALWLSYSRGALLGLIAGSLLALLAVRAPIKLAPRATAAAACALIALGMLVPAQPIRAQDEPEFRLADPAPTPIGYLDLKHQEWLEERKQLNVDGIERGLDDLVNPSSLELRKTYWQVGLRMIAHHPLTGVGLGNFKIAYRRYQFLGAGDVEAAHNDFLEYFATTGLLGGALFTGFWVYFVGSGFLALVRMPPGTTRLLAAGVYAGTIAFTIHSLVDFNFQNPALGSLAFIMAGAFYALTALKLPPGRIPVNAGRIAAIAVGVLVAISAGSILRVYLFDFGLTEGTLARRLYDVGDRKTFRVRMDAANRVFDTLGQYDPESRTPPYMALTTAKNVIPDIGVLQSVGQIRVRDAADPTYVRVLRPNEDIPRDAIYFVQDMNGLFRHAVQRIEARRAVLKEWDEMYPHDPELASHIFSWYDILFQVVQNPAVKKRYAVEAEHWAKAGVDRSPKDAWWRLGYAKALWMRAALEPGEAGIEYYYAGLEQYETASELYPRSPVVASRYGQALVKLGNALKEAGRVDEGANMTRKGQETLRRAEVLDRYKNLA